MRSSSAVYNVFVSCNVPVYTLADISKTFSSEVDVNFWLSSARTCGYGESVCKLMNY